MSDDFAIERVAPDGLPGKMGAWEVTGSKGTIYRVCVYDPDGEVCSCTCPDHRLRHRVCKHIRAVLERLG